MSTVDISSHNRAAQKLESGGYTALVAIGPPYSDKVLATTLRLTFPDTTPNRKPLNGMATGLDILRLIQFCRKLTPQDKVLIYCQRGKSRSTAVALIAMHCLGMNEDGCVRSLFGRYPKSWPNGWVLKLADAILGCSLFDSCKRVNVKW